jgi:DNA-binding GntR family transcriptional regulator
LLEHEANKGIRVTRPSRESIAEIYAVRRLLELPALRNGESTHPSAAVMQAAVENARSALGQNDWRRVGSADLDFHHGVVSLTNNSRLTSLHDSLATELRLAFGVIDDPAVIHGPFISRNEQILQAFVSGRQNDAVDLMDSYLTLSEELVLDAYAGRS